MLYMTRALATDVWVTAVTKHVVASASTTATPTSSGLTAKKRRGAAARYRQATQAVSTRAKPRPRQNRIVQWLEVIRRNKRLSGLRTSTPAEVIRTPLR